MPSKLEEALQRYRFLKKITEERATRAARGVGATEGVYSELGVVQTGEKTDRARTRVARFHDRLSKSIDQLGFLEIVAAFEAEMGTRIDNAIGTAKGVVKSGFSVSDALSRQAEGLIRAKDSFQSLKAIEDLVAKYLRVEAGKAFVEIRHERNRLAHGESEQPVKVTPQTAYEVLTEVLADAGASEEAS